MGELLKPAAVAEPIIEQSDRRVVVIGTDHGSNVNAIFPGLSQTEKEIEDYFDGEPLDGLMLDSLPRIESLHEGLSPDNFYGWGMQYMGEHRTHLIVADPVSLNRAFSNVSTVEQAIAAFRRAKPVTSGQTTTDQTDKIFVQTEEDELLKTILLGCAIGSVIGLSTQAYVGHTRRHFLGMLGGALIGGAVAPGLKFLFPQSHPVEGQKIIRLEVDPNIVDEVDKFAKQPRQLTEEDYATDWFQNLSSENQRDLQYSVVFRNAVIADALEQPILTIMPWTQTERARMAAVMGTMHLIVPKEGRIGWLLSHKAEREQIINVSIQSLFRGVKEDKFFGKINIDEMKEGFINMGRSYIVDPVSHEVNTATFPIPALEKAVQAVA